MHQEILLFNTNANRNHIRSNLSANDVKKKNDSIHRVVATTTAGHIVFPSCAFCSAVSTVAHKSLIRGFKDGATQGPSANAERTTHHQLGNVHRQCKSRPIACPPMRDESKESKEFSRNLDELSRVYDSATWRMYDRIVSSRNTRKFGIDGQQNSMLSPNSRGSEGTNHRDKNRCFDENQSGMANITERHDNIFIESINMPELEDDEGIFALDMEL